MIESHKLKDGSVLEIHHDETPQNPRTEWDNVAEFIFFHGRYNVGDEHSVDPDNYTGWDAMESELFSEDDIVLPVYAYTKRVFELSTKPFSCPWDSGRLGFAVVRKEQIDYEFDGDREKAERCLLAELNTYNDYLNGRVYGYIIRHDDGLEDDFIDSCWGYYGESGIEYIKQDYGITA